MAEPINLTISLGQIICKTSNEKYQHSYCSAGEFFVRNFRWENLMIYRMIWQYEFFCHPRFANGNLIGHNDLLQGDGKRFNVIFDSEVGLYRSSGISIKNRFFSGGRQSVLSKITNQILRQKSKV